VFGFCPTLPLDLVVDVKARSVEDILARRRQVSTQVKTLLKTASMTMKKRADCKRRESEWAVGDSVLLSTSHLPLRAGARKLAERWTGPFRVLSQVSAAAWRLDLPSTWKVHPVFHSSQLRPVVGRPRLPEPIILDETPDEEFEVDHIVASRMVRGAE
jgi:hypothetical protein